jgi:hypothetical protein
MQKNKLDASVTLDIVVLIVLSRNVLLEMMSLEVMVLHKAETVLDVDFVITVRVFVNALWDIMVIDANIRLF